MSTRTPALPGCFHSYENVVDHVAVHIRQPVVTSLVAVHQSLVIESEQMAHRRTGHAH